MRENSYKVGIVVNSLNYGGNERSAINIAKYLPEEYETTIIIQEDNYSIPYDGKVISLHCPCKKSFIGKIKNSFKRLVALKRIVKKEKFDCILIILPITNIINYSHFGCKKIVSCREYGDLVRHLKYYRAMAAKSDKIVFNSKLQQDYFESRVSEYKEKCITIYNIIDIDSIIIKSKETPEKEFLDFIENKKVVVSVGRFAEQKGFNHLLKSFKILTEKETDARLIMIGDGDLRPKIETLISELDISDKVLLLGFQKNLYKYVSRSNVFAMSSYSEGFPNVIIEALACGTPVVSTDCPSGPAEILSFHNQRKVSEGFQVDDAGVRTMEFSRDSDSWNPDYNSQEHVVFSEALYEVLNNTELAKTLSENGRKRLEKYKGFTIALEWENLLHE